MYIDDLLDIDVLYTIILEKILKTNQKLNVEYFLQMSVYNIYILFIQFYISHK